MDGAGGWLIYVGTFVMVLSAGFLSACVQCTFRETVCRRVKQRVIVCSEATSTAIYTAISEQAGRASAVSGSPTGETSAVEEAGG